MGDESVGHVVNDDVVEVFDGDELKVFLLLFSGDWSWSGEEDAPDEVANCLVDRLGLDVKFFCDFEIWKLLVPANSKGNALRLMR